MPKQGFCGICYQVCDTSVTDNNKKFLLTAPIAAAAVDAECKYDWIQIPCATDQQSSTQLLSDGATACVSKICGGAFSAVTTAPKPAPVYSMLILSLNHLSFT
jgi:hypothetical protein